MPDDTLQSYVEIQRASGIPDNAIKSALLANNWGDSDVDAALFVSTLPTKPIHIPKQIRAVSILLGLLALTEFGAGFGILIVVFTLNAALSKNNLAPPYEFVRYLNGLLIKGFSSTVSGVIYTYVAMRVIHMDKKAMSIAISTVIIILILEVITGTIAMSQLTIIQKAMSLTSGG